MANIICYNVNTRKFNIYGTIVDGFYFEKGITESELHQWYEKQYGERGKLELPMRIGRAKKKGHSSMIDPGGLVDFLSCNLAGPNQTHIPPKECIDRFLS